MSVKIRLKAWLFRNFPPFRNRVLKSTFTRGLDKRPAEAASVNLHGGAFLLAGLISRKSGRPPGQPKIAARRG